MGLKRNTYKQIMEFNRRTFQEKIKRRKQLARLPFEEKLKIIEEINTLSKAFKKAK